MTDQKKARIFQSVQLIAVMAELIGIEYQIDLTDSKINPAINNHSRRIKESSEAIKTHLSSIVNNKQRDFISNEYSVEMHRVMSYFICMPIENIRDIMDKIEKV